MLVQRGALQNISASRILGPWSRVNFPQTYLTELVIVIYPIGIVEDEIPAQISFRKLNVLDAEEPSRSRSQIFSSIRGSSRKSSGILIATVAFSLIGLMRCKLNVCRC